VVWLVGEGDATTAVGVGVLVADGELTTVAPTVGVGGEVEGVRVAAKVATAMGVFIGVGVRLGVGDGVEVKVGVAGRGV
jgi:hypothetical protein